MFVRSAGFGGVSVTGAVGAIVSVRTSCEVILESSTFILKIGTSRNSTIMHRFNHTASKALNISTIYLSYVQHGNTNIPRESLSRAHIQREVTIKLAPVNHNFKFKRLERKEQGTKCG